MLFASSGTAGNMPAAIEMHCPKLDAIELAIAPQSMPVKNAPKTFASAGTTTLISDGKAAAKFFEIDATSGIKLPITCSTDSISFCVMPDTSPLGSASAVSQFSQAAFIVSIEPDIVCDASSAELPAMPCASCTSWIALTTSPNFSMDKSPARPCAFSSLLASAIRRSISDLVPPYIVFGAGR